MSKECVNISEVSMTVFEFIRTHPVFSYTDYLAGVGGGERNKRTLDALLFHHVKRGHLLRVRRGLFVSVPVGEDPENCPVDRFLLAGKMVEGGVLAYHTALEFHGEAYSLWNRSFVLSDRTPSKMLFRGDEFFSLPIPGPLRRKGEEVLGVETRERLGLPLHVTTLERTLVDVLDRPELSGGWEEVWRSLESIRTLDLDLVVRYTLALENATTTAKVGFFLERHRESLMVDEKHLSPLREGKPRTRHYMDRKRRSGGRFVREWNLIVPEEVIHRSWEENYGSVTGNSP